MTRRILMVHAARDSTCEYDVHFTLAQNAPPETLECHFVCQRRGAESIGRAVETTARVTPYEFGRNLSLRPRPSRARRARMMLAAAPGAARLIRSRVRAIRPDAVYTSQQRIDIHIGRLVEMAYGIPHIVHAHYPVGPWLGRSTLRLLRATNRLIAVSEFVRKTAVDAGVPDRAIAVLPNPLQPTLGKSARERGCLRSRLGIDGTAPLVLSVGRLDPEKNHSALIAAFANVAREIPEARLVICGESTKREDFGEELRLHAETLGVGRKVLFPGTVHDIESAYADADVFALASAEEAFGLVYLEAMAHGLPVVGSVSGAVPEVVLDGETGFLADPGDVAQLTGHLLTLLRHSSVAKRMGEAGRRRAVEAFAVGPIASQWAEIVGSMCRESH